MTTLQQKPNGTWAPAVPIPAPRAVRRRCDHRFIPADTMIGWACVRCGERRDGAPQDGVGAIGRLLTRLGR